MSIKVLAVDDAQETTWILKRVLNEAGYEVQVAHDGLQGLRLAYSFQPDIILLDVMMPDMDGWSMLCRLREFSDVPVIMLTAVNDEANKVQGLDWGADDYLTKPFGMEELKARIRATLRRTSSGESRESPVLRFDTGRLLIDPASHQVSVDGQPVDLTPTEYKLLIYLAYNAGQVLSSEQILDNVWGPGYEDGTDNVKVYVWSLRQKIEANPSDPVYIQTKRGVGYFMPKI